MGRHVVQGCLGVVRRGVAEDGVEAGLKCVSDWLFEKSSIIMFQVFKAYHEILVFCPRVAVEGFEDVVLRLEGADAVRAGDGLWFRRHVEVCMLLSRLILCKDRKEDSRNR